MVSCTSNTHAAKMRYKIINSEAQQRVEGTTNVQKFDPTELNPLNAYPIEAHWNTDANP